MELSVKITLWLPLLRVIRIFGISIRPHVLLCFDSLYQQIFIVLLNVLFILHLLRLGLKLVTLVNLASSYFKILILKEELLWAVLRLVWKVSCLSEICIYFVNPFLSSWFCIHREWAEQTILELWWYWRMRWYYWFLILKLCRSSLRANIKIFLWFFFGSVFSIYLFIRTKVRLRLLWSFKSPFSFFRWAWSRFILTFLCLHVVILL